LPSSTHTGGNGGFAKKSGDDSHLAIRAVAADGGYMEVFDTQVNGFYCAAAGFFAVKPEINPRCESPVSVVIIMQSARMQPDVGRLGQTGMGVASVHGTF
jgi:hypothetical protein